MSNYKTPGVYVEEISKLPPSVAQVATAIPAFIGYTETGDDYQIERISSMLEYKRLFGGPPTASFEFNANTSSTTGLTSLELTGEPIWNSYMLYYCLQLFFANGGGACYVVSVGNYTDSRSKGRFVNGLDAIEKYDEPTLLLLSEATIIGNGYYCDVCDTALAQCAKLKDRFTIMDAIPDNDVDASFFRDNVSSNLSYGAAYTPFLKTTIAYEYEESNIQITLMTDGVTNMVTESFEEGGAAGAVAGPEVVTLDSLKTTQTALYNQVKVEMDKQLLELPPSPAIAGIYSTVDGTRGVWKAPANVALSAVIGPTRTISNEEQEALNVDATSGKSINAIRNFTGKGTLVWGARTLLGNDNEWRYINVRRLFITIEESVQKATAFAVFEPNDATTWLKVKAMIDNYLYSLWQQGALAGPTPEAAYFVNIGLGKTMTDQDILEGRMIVEIGAAAVRPAEFIILRFSHKLQEA